jgi:hypothetical protein
LKSLFGRNAGEPAEPREYLPDAWDARIHQAIFRDGRNRDVLRALGYRTEFRPDSCKSEIKHGAVWHDYRAAFRLFLATDEYSVVHVNFAVSGSNSDQAEIDFPVGFAAFSWEMPGSRRVPLLHVRVWDKAGLSERMNDLYRTSRLPSAQPLLVCLNLAIDHLADIPPEQCWGPWSEVDDPDDRWPGRASVQLVGYEFSATY